MDFLIVADRYSTSGCYEVHLIIINLDIWIMLSLGKFAFIKRLKSALFYDYAWLSVPARDTNGKVYPNYHEFDMKSFGLELTSDLHVLRFFAPIEMGFRTIYRPDFRDFQFNLLFSIDFNGF